MLSPAYFLKCLTSHFLALKHARVSHRIMTQPPLVFTSVRIQVPVLRLICENALSCVFYTRLHIYELLRLGIKGQVSHSCRAKRKSNVLFNLIFTNIDKVYKVLDYSK